MLSLGLGGIKRVPDIVLRLIHSIDMGHSYAGVALLTHKGCD